MLRFTFACLTLALFGCGHHPGDSIENIPPTVSAPAPVSVDETATEPGLTPAATAAGDAGAGTGDAAPSVDAGSDAAMGAKCTELATSCCAIMVSCTGEVTACQRVAAAKNDGACAALLTGYESVGCDHEIDVPPPMYPPPSTFHGCPYKGNHGGAIP